MYKILHITNSLGTGGAEKLLVDVAGLLDKSRFRTSVCCFGTDGPARPALESAGAEVTVLDKPRRSSLLFPVFCADVASLLASITAEIRRRSPDLVHTHLEGNYIGPFCARLAGVEPVVAHFHSSVLLPLRGGRSIRNAGRRMVLGTVARMGSVLLAGSNFAAQAAARECGVDVDKVTVIYNAVDVSRVDAEPRNHTIREELGLPAGEKLLVTLGTLKEPKNHRLLIKAMKRVVARRDGVSAVIIGAGRDEFARGLEDMAAGLGVADKVLFLGYRDDAYGIVKSSDLMVLPSLWEGLPVAALEGMACGVPVLLSDIPPHREAVTDGVDGWLFRTDDEASLAERILSILDDERAAKRVALAGSGMVRERFDSSRMARSLERLYESRIAGAAG